MVKTNNKKILFVIFSLSFIIPLVSCSSSAITISVSNSEDWVDVYSLMLSSALNEDKAVFLNSKTMGSLTKTKLLDKDIIIYESSVSPLIENLESQLNSQGYSVAAVEESEDFNVYLDPGKGKYYVISEYNPRVTISLAPLAIKKDYWIFIVNEDNIDEVADKLADANSVIAVGEFRRDFWDSIEPYVDERINNKDPFKDSIEIASKYGPSKSVILADGNFIEEDFFTGSPPVLVTGFNKLGDSLFDYFEDEGIKTVTIIGNEMAVVGEQIRERSDKDIAVFIKYGQGTSSSGGEVFALSEFPLPSARLALTITKSIYDPDQQKLAVYFKNLGNTGLYELTSLSVKTNGEEIATASDEEVQFLGGGETYVSLYDVSIPMDKVKSDTIVEYYTSFGVYPSELNNFLTLEDEYGPPYRTPLEIESLAEDTSSLEIVDAAYYTNLKRVGVTLSNTGSSTAYYSVTVEDLIIHGLEDNLFAEDSIRVGEEKTTYMSVELDDVDIQENSVFKITVRYGSNEESKFNTLSKELPFKTERGSMLTGFAVFAGGETGSIIIIVIVIVVIVLGVGLLFFKRRR